MIGFARDRSRTLSTVFLLATLTCALYAVGARLWPGWFPRAGGELLVTASWPWSLLALHAGKDVLAQAPTLVSVMLGYAAIAFGFGLNATAATALLWFLATAGRRRARR